MPVDTSYFYSNLYYLQNKIKSELIFDIRLKQFSFIIHKTGQANNILYAAENNGMKLGCISENKTPYRFGDKYYTFIGLFATYCLINHNKWFMCR